VVALIAAAEPQPDGKYAPESKRPGGGGCEHPDQGCTAQNFFSASQQVPLALAVDRRRAHRFRSAARAGQPRTSVIRPMATSASRLKAAAIEFEDRTGQVQLTFSVRCEP